MALESHGVVFFWSTVAGGNGATAATNAIGEVISFSGPSGGAGIIDITHLGSTFKEKLQGVPDEGQLTIECNFTTYLSDTAANQGLLRASRGERREGSWTLKTSTVVTGGDQVVIKGRGFVTTLTPSGAVDDKISLSVTIEINGKTTWA